MKNSLKFFSFWLLLALCTTTVLFISCSKDDDRKKEDPLTFDKGVIINGVKWATRNVATPGTFADKPEDPGMFYQWNRKMAWAATGDVTDWDATIPEGDTWEKTNDPSPAGWRVPTLAEIQSLFDTVKVNNEWITVKGVNGREFIDKATGNTLFLTAAGFRYFCDGTLIGIGSYGGYWSSTALGNGGAGWDNYGYRNEGFSVRSVAD